MIQQFHNIPYAIPFTFTSVDDDARSQVEVLIPYNVAVYGIAIVPSQTPQTDYYHSTIQFLNYQTGDTLFDEGVGNFCLQCDARTYFQLPSKWYIRKNEKIICSLDSADDVSSTTFYVTLLGYVTDSDPNPGVQPFAYSYPISIGFQDNVSGSTTAVPFNQGFTGTLAKHMINDFDIHGFVLDPFAFNGVDNIPSMSFQLSTQRRKLYDRFLITGVAGGGSVFAQGDVIPLLPTTGANVHGFPEDSALQYWLPKAERVYKGELVRVDVAPAPTYLGTDAIHTNLSEIAYMAVIGNHIG